MGIANRKTQHQIQIEIKVQFKSSDYHLGSTFYIPLVLTYKTNSREEQKGFPSKSQIVKQTMPWMKQEDKPPQNTGRGRYIKGLKKNS
jgi:hypothetical protein